MDEIEKLLTTIEKSNKLHKDNNELIELILKKAEILNELKETSYEIKIKAIEKNLECIRKVSRYHSITLLLLGIQAIMISFFLFH
ncbi:MULTISPECIES: hypothetical protein [Fusobacterium]|nr:MULTISPECIES: hypothetical protein [Fusobacterium]